MMKEVLEIPQFMKLNMKYDIGGNIVNATEKFDLYDAAERKKAKYARAEKIRKIKNIIKIVIIGLIVAYLLGLVTADVVREMFCSNLSRNNILN